MTSAKPTEEAERRRFEQALDDVGDNLPDDIPGVEGADVGRIVRKGHPAHEADAEGEGRH